MTVLVLGEEPQGLSVPLTRGQSFQRVLEFTEPDGVTPVEFEAGDELVLILAGIEWPAVLVGSEATWSKTATDVDAVQTAARTIGPTAELWFRRPADDIAVPWFLGVID